MMKLFETYEIDSGKSGPHVLITAGVHGDEYEPIVAARKLVEEITTLLRNGRVTIVPVVNVSAYEHKSRCGEDGLDLARTCPGKRHGSVTEQVAFQVSELIRKADYYIDLHTGGKIFEIFPLAGYMLHNSQRVLDAQRKMAEVFGLPVIWGTDRYAEGRTLSVARDANVPAIYVEYGGPDPIRGDIVKKYAEGCLNVLAVFSMLHYNLNQEPNLLYWVEDYRLNNGHLQSKNPAPVEGIFLPGVQPGASVKCGDLWGAIHDYQTGNQTEIRTESDGIVLFTRIRGHVKKDDSLGGLLPITEPGKIIFDEQ
jgi:predicted deacylase